MKYTCLAGALLFGLIAFRGFYISGEVLGVPICVALMFLIADFYQFRLKRFPFRVISAFKMAGMGVAIVSVTNIIGIRKGSTLVDDEFCGLYLLAGLLIWLTAWAIEKNISNKSSEPT